MNKAIWIIIVIAVIIGVLAFIYYSYVPQEKDFVNVSISANYEGKKIETGFIISPIMITGNTSQSYETYSIEKQVITVKNINIEGQEFYEEDKVFNVTKNTRIDLKLTKPQEIKYTIIKDDVDNLINLTVYSENYREIDFCLKGTFNYLFLKAPDYTKTNIENYENYDSCYDGNFSLINNNKTITITYLEFSRPKNDDFIEIVLLDKQNNNKTIKLK